MQQLHAPPRVLGPVDGHLEQAAVHLHGDRRVVVARHRVGNQAGVAVRVHHADRGDVHLGRVADAHVRLEHVVERGEEDDEVGQADPGAVLHRGVGEQAALPVARVGVLAAALRRVLHQVDELPLAADEQDDAAAVRHVGREVQGLLEVLHRLVQVDYVLVQAAAVEVRLHEPTTQRRGEFDLGLKIERSILRVTAVILTY